MDDLLYQVDMLSALNKTYTANEKIYDLILNSFKRTFIYYNPNTSTLNTYGNWDEYFDFKLTEYSDLTRTLELICEEDRENVRNLFYLEKEHRDDEVYVAKLVDNKTFVEIQSVIHYDETGAVSEKLISFYDVTKRQNLKNELSFMAYYDSVTGLYNRNYFIQKLKDFLDRAEKERTIVSVLMIDIDDFHKINDGMGIIYGDEVVQDFGIFLRELLNDKIIGSRFDGDIYALAIYDPAGQTRVDSICDIIKERTSKPFKLTNGSEVSFTVSIGVSEYPEGGTGALELINGAEIVMLKAKEAGKDTIKFFDTTVLNEFKNSIDIENRLKIAVNNMDFYLNFQPQFNSVTQTLRGVEALIRWKNPDGKVISPGLFIPLAEKTGSIIAIGDWVLDTSIRIFTEWKKKYDYDMILSVNISSIQYKRPDFVTKVMSTVNKYGLDPSKLELEITETVLIDDMKTVFEKMEELRDFGIRISIDDFGTGYSSLQYLKSLPADTLKLDKTFIDSAENDNSTKIIIETMIGMSKKLGFETVAEGVETKEQLDILENMGCDIIQGYYLGKPVSDEEIENLLLRII
ncbi:MAG: bifunctional diguanylate cyclase/phosphodiesterase [Lachnospiraceae bacterium]|nr:bifunctional diguanylate cyclase/phosphodiesterase [Lachnospiraceae bacterium]